MGMDANLKLNLGWRRRVPVVLQSEAAECGLACLAMIGGHYGGSTDLRALRRAHGMSIKGATLRDLVHIGAQMQLGSRPLRLDLKELSQLRLPCVLHWDLNHFVVLVKVEARHIVIHDPAFGMRRLAFADASRHFTGVALEVAPASDFRVEARAPRVRIDQLMGNVTALRGALAHVLMLALALEVFAMAGPMFVSSVVDHALVGGDRELLISLALGFGLLLLLQIAITAMRGFVVMSVNAALRVSARGNLFGHLVDLPSAYFESRHLGDLMSRFGSQDTILQALTGDLVEACLDGMMATMTLGILFYMDAPLGSIILLVAILYAVIRRATYGSLRRAASESIIWSARRDSHFLETLRGIRTVKLFNAQIGRRLQWLNLQVETVNRQLTREKIAIAMKASNRLLLGSLRILVVFMGAWKVLDGGFSTGMLLAFLAYQDQFLTRVSALIDRSSELAMIRLHGERLADIALTAPESVGPPPMAGGLVHLPFSIEFRDVTFRYGENEPYILKNLSFRVQAGESVAIVGPSGGGKTTLLKLIAGLLTPSAGEILINTTPLARLGLAEYRAKVGVVMQDDQLFDGSIGENIAFFAESPDFELIEACGRLAALHDDVAAMPMGYHTLTGDMGNTLSGGQKQRVLIARAFYRRPSMLLLDEATSHLDVERERAVNTAMRSFQITRIIIAHRPETIRAADRVIEIVDGTARPAQAGPVRVV